MNSQLGQVYLIAFCLANVLLLISNFPHDGQLKLTDPVSFAITFFVDIQTLFSIILFRKNLYDIHGQPVLFHRELIKKINYFPKDFSVDLALYIYAKKKNYKIIRFPVNFNKKRRYFGEGSSNNIIKKIKASIEQVYQAFLILKNL